MMPRSSRAGAAGTAQPPSQSRLPPALAAQLAPGRGGTWAVGITLAILVLYMTVPLDVLTPREQLVNGYEVNPVARFIKVGLLLAGWSLVLSRLSVARRVMAETNVFFRIFLGLVPLSYLWSISPADTLLRFVAILTVLGVCLGYCSAGWHPRRFQAVVRPCISLILLASLLAGIAYPDVVKEHGEGTLMNAWRGLTQQKNEFGQLASFGTIFWVHAALARDAPLWKTLPMGLMAAWCLLLSRSSTSLLSTAFAAILLLMLLRSPPSLRRYMPYLVGLFAGAVLAYALAVLRLVPGLTTLLLEPIAALTGKDTTFSNRSTIWTIIKEHIQLHPLFGTGYGAYWIGPVPTSPSYEFIGRMYFYPSESHNGYLEMVNDLGFVGLMVLIGFLVVFVRQALQLLQADRAQGALFIGLFFQQAIMNLSESTWLTVNSSFLFTLMTLATVALGRSLLQAKAAGGGTAQPPLARRPGGLAGRRRR